MKIEWNQQQIDKLFVLREQFFELKEELITQYDRELGTSYTYQGANKLYRSIFLSCIFDDPSLVHWIMYKCKTMIQNDPEIKIGLVFEDLSYTDEFKKNCPDFSTFLSLFSPKNIQILYWSDYTTSDPTRDRKREDESKIRKFKYMFIMFNHTTYSPGEEFFLRNFRGRMIVFC